MPFTPNELIEKLKEYRIKASRGTILNYEKWGLIGAPIKATGKEKVYSDMARAEFVASYRIMHGYDLNPEETNGIREIATQIAANFIHDIDNIEQTSLTELMDYTKKFYCVVDYYSLRLASVWLQEFVTVLRWDVLKEDDHRKMLDALERIKNGSLFAQTDEKRTRELHEKLNKK